MQWALAGGLTLAALIALKAIQRANRANTDLDTFVRWFLLRYEVADEVAEETEFELVEADIGHLTEN